MKMMQKHFISTLAASLCACAFSFNASAAPAENWDSLVSQAKQEGSLTFSVWYFQPQWRNIVKTFEQQYGIQVRIPEGTLDGNVNKLLAEAKKPKGKIDVIAFSVNNLPVITKFNTLQKIDWLPEYKNAYHTIQNVDSNGYGAVFWGNQTGFAYDPQQMGSRPLPQTIDQLQQFIDANPRKFGYNDPGNGGAGAAFIQRIILAKSGDFNSAASQTDATVIASWQKGWQWFNDNKAKITYTASGADSLTRLNDGELMLTPAWQDHLDSLQKTGAVTSRLKFYLPEFGMPGGGNFAGIAANSPHPAASALFINWLIQPQTQQLLQQTFGTKPMNITLSPAEQQAKNKVEFFGAAYSTALQKEFINHVLLKQ